MSSLGIDNRIRNGARWARIKRSAGLSPLSAAVVGSLTIIAADSADDLELPASFRNWYQVNTMLIDKGSPLFEAMGGMHNVYINSTGEAALKKGEPYRDKTVLLVDLHGGEVPKQGDSLRFFLRGAGRQETQIIVFDKGLVKERPDS